MKRTRIGFVLACVVLSAFAASVCADPPQPTLWTKQIGTGSPDGASGIAVDAGGNCYVTGDSEGNFGGANQGATDVFIVKYDSSGVGQWIALTGTAQADRSRSIALDAGGGSYIAGATEGDLQGTNQGGEDAFVMKCDGGGTYQWARQMGTSEADWGCGIALDGSGNIYTAGYTHGDLEGPSLGYNDAFLVKHDSGGTWQWTRQFGTDVHDYGLDLVVDGSGNSYTVGYTGGDLGGPSHGSYDAFVVKYDSSGTPQWARQPGSTSQDYAQAVTLDAGGNIYVAGDTEGDLGGPNQGNTDAFIVKYDSGGTLQWARQMGGSWWDHASGIVADSSGNIYIAGGTYGGLSGPFKREWDIFVAKYDSDGTLLWTRQIDSGQGKWDIAQDIGVDAASNIYITGHTNGDLGGPNAGEEDVFVMAISAQAAVPGDANLNGCVDGLDYIVWSNNYHQSDKRWEDGDFTGEGYVDGLDYIAWSNNYGVGCPGQIPAPGCGLLLLLGVWAVRRRRRCSV